MWRITSVLFTAYFLRLPPTRGEAETKGNETKANNHIPSPDMRDWVLSAADVEDHDPKEANDEPSDHEWSEPFWALLRQGGSVRHGF